MRYNGQHQFNLEVDAIRILFACGGTGGHINPGLAIASYLRARHPNAVIAFAGNPRGMEANLVPKAGFDFLPIKVQGFQRQLKWFNVKYNMRSLRYLLFAPSHAKRMLRDFNPDIVVGTGGYVSGPVLDAAVKLGIKTVAHEQNALPGITTKLLSKRVDLLLLAVEQAREYLAKGCKTVVVGNPIREEILFADRARAREELGVGERVCILSFGGSQGARRINEAVAQLIKSGCGEGHHHHIHATGKYGVQLMKELLGEENDRIRALPYMDIREYISDMPRCLAAADLVICRSGAITLSELQAAGKASILIPSPNVAENHQYHNAMVLQKADAAVVIEEKNLTGALLQETVCELTQNKETLKRLGANAQKMAILDANERMYKEIMALLRNP